MDNALKDIIADNFTSWELVELLEISIWDIIEAHQEVLEDNIEEIKDTIGYKGIELDGYD